MKIPFFNYPSVYNDHRDAFIEILDKVGQSGAFIMQSDLEDFEKEIAAYTGAKYAIGVGNATDALEMLLKSAGITDGDEVILSTHTMIATASAIVANGGTPVPINCSEDHLINIEEIQKEINSKTKCILPTQLNGRTANMEKINYIAEKNGLFIIEDSAQALGSKFKGKSAGTFGLGGCFSFYPAKVLGCLGDGGMIVCNDDLLYENLLKDRDHGRNSNTGDVDIWGRNSRLDNLQASFLRYQFQFYEKVISRRRAIAKFYCDELKIINSILLPPEPSINDEHYDIYQNFEIEVTDRKNFTNYLESKGIGTLVQWGGKGIHQFKKLGFNKQLHLSDKILKEMLLLPMNMSLHDEEVEYIVKTIISYFNDKKQL